MIMIRAFTGQSMSRFLSAAHGTAPAQKPPHLRIVGGHERVAAVRRLHYDGLLLLLAIAFANKKWVRECVHLFAGCDTHS